MVLVTGGSGFLGRHLVRQLAASGQEVRALYHRNAPSADMHSLPGVVWQQCDLLDVFDVEEAMAGITDIYHCAAIVSFSPAMAETMLHFNPESTANIVNEAITHDIRKLVYVSSVAALGRNSEAKEVTEEQEWGESSYSSAYGLSKYLAETEVWRGVGEGLNATIINPSVILGAGDWHTGSPQLITLADKEFPFYTNGINGWVDVHDVVRIMVQLMNSDITAERFIVSGGNHSYREVFNLMADALGKKQPSFRAGPFITSMAWRIGALLHRITGKSPVITRETARTAQSIVHYNNSKLLQTFPSFHYTPLRETIDRMAGAFRKRNIQQAQI